MAKTQTFGDKVSGKKGADKVVCKIIKGYRSEEGTTRFLEQNVKLDNLDNVDKVDINR